MVDHLPKVDKDVEKKVEQFKDGFFRQAELLVTDFFPRQILEMDKILQSPEWNITDFDSLKEDFNADALHNGDVGEPCSKRPRISKDPTYGYEIYHGVVPANKFIQRLATQLKPIIRTLIEKCNTVKMWVTLLIPKIEDGNNFGVSIQEDTLKEVYGAEEDGSKFLEGIGNYNFTRAKLASKFIKYPGVEDYKLAIHELDEKEYVSLRLTCCEIRNHYSALFDLITKNFEKIKKPRSSHTSSLY